MFIHNKIKKTFESYFKIYIHTHICDTNKKQYFEKDLEAFFIYYKFYIYISEAYLDFF